MSYSNEEVQYLPGQLQSEIDFNKLSETEKKLPLPTHGSGPYKYFNPLRCPYCAKPFIDFEKYPEIRTTEYYGNHFLNKETQKI